MYFDIRIYFILVFIIGLILPAILIPVVSFTGYSEIIEELAKLLVVVFLILKLPNHKSPHQTRISASGANYQQSSFWCGGKLQIVAGLLFGFLFGLSENIFYLTNIFNLGNFSVFLQRFIWTAPMHIATTLVILFSAISNKKFIVFGLAGALIIHILFNEILVVFLAG